MGSQPNATLGPTPHTVTVTVLSFCSGIHRYIVILCHLSVAETHHSSLYWSAVPGLRCVSDWWARSVPIWNGSRHQLGVGLHVCGKGGCPCWGLLHMHPVERVGTGSIVCGRQGQGQCTNRVVRNPVCVQRTAE